MRMPIFKAHELIRRVSCRISAGSLSALRGTHTNTPGSWVFVAVVFAERRLKVTGTSALLRWSSLPKRSEHLCSLSETGQARFDLSKPPVKV